MIGVVVNSKKVYNVGVVVVSFVQRSFVLRRGVEYLSEPGSARAALEGCFIEFRRNYS